MVAVLRC